MFAYRHSLYGTDDAYVVLDLGSSLCKCGFSGESRPRFVYRRVRLFALAELPF